jgi:diaminopimelate decarboxylase
VGVVQLPGIGETVREALARCDRATLLFDLARIERNIDKLALAAAEIGATALFASKSFPHPAVRALAAQRLAGFDVASPGEVDDAIAEAPRSALLAVGDPSGRAIAAAARWPGRLVISCETPAQVAAAPRHAEIAVRLSASRTGRDPAVGAVLDGSGHRRSRFGLDVDRANSAAQLVALARAAAGRPVGLHVHHGPVSATSSERFVATARAALEVAEAAGLAPAFLDLGGAWHAVADLPATLRAIRAAVPSTIELRLEPGRLLADGAGFACGRVEVARMLDDRPLRVVALSRICHLRWSQVQLIAPAPRPGEGVTALFVGPTCYEDDVLGDWAIEPAWFDEGDRVVLRNVTGYALAWNTGFGGTAPAEVVLI